MVGRASEVQFYRGRQGVAPELRRSEEEQAKVCVELVQVKRGGQEAQEWSL